MPVMQLDSLRDTTLWKRLHQSFSGKDGELAQAISHNLVAICQDAYERMKAFPSLHPEFTLHDATHLLRVTELAARIMPESVADLLNPVELMLLILAAHFHDQGMVLDREELGALRHDPAFSLYHDNWALSHPNLRAIQQRLRDKTLSSSEKARCRYIESELDAALLTDFIRQTHGERSARFVRSTYLTDKRWEVAGANVAEFVARLCDSHVRPAHDLVPANGFRFDEVIGSYRVNMPYIGLVLRLADILDFDRDRTPDSLYRTIHFQSPVSLSEWEKHRAVEGWIIQPELVQFTMRCEHPEYQRAANHFMDWIDRELTAAQALCRFFPASASNYKLSLPLAVDRSRIEPKDGAYIYSDLEFSLSRDEIVKLLLTDQLYGHPWIAVRELLQNSLDALRHRKAIIRRDLGAEWLDGRVEMVHYLDADGYEVLRCTDNGAGMDRPTIERFLTRAGRSYYRSPEFEQERASFRAKGFDFDPCGQFGIGFMSCFMLGDRISISTRRDLGHQQGLGEPLLVEINGLSGIVVLRSGKADQPVGTTVEIVVGHKPSFLDRRTDKVKLLAVLDGYALATEFPIIGKCEIPELAGSVTIEPAVAIRKTRLESSGVQSIETIEILFSQIHESLGGSMRASFLVDSEGSPVLATPEAQWVGGQIAPELIIENEDNPRHFDKDSTCMDGILVVGEPGRHTRAWFLLGKHGNRIDAGDNVCFTLDIRGRIKPPLSPSRLPPDRGLAREDPRWEYIQMLVNRTKGMLLHQLAMRFKHRLDPETFWALVLIYGGSVGWIPAGTLWSHMLIPVGGVGGYEWKKFSDLQSMELESNPTDAKGERETILKIESSGQRIGVCPPLLKWWRQERNLSWLFTALVAASSTVTLSPAGARLVVRHPEELDAAPSEAILKKESIGMTFFLNYSAEVKDLLAIHLPLENVNRAHPLARIVLGGRWLDQKTDLQKFALETVRLLAQTANFDHPNYQYWQKRVGHLHKAIDWESIDREYHPPYKLRTVDGYTIEVTHATFEQWADLKVDSPL